MRWLTLGYYYDIVIAIITLFSVDFHITITT